jgi:6-phosphogluconolactonase/glucosamine-6-phosphate isomerase/deaminase
MARTTFLDEVEPRSIQSMYQPDSTAEAGADRYDGLLKAAPPLALVHLGLGPDGHTASLFPGSPALAVQDRLVVPTPGDATHPHDRLTFTYPALARSELVVFTVHGAEKRDAMARVRGAGDVPAAKVTASRVVWLLDPAAAGDQ